jgi:hypothetical protein
VAQHERRGARGSRNFKAMATISAGRQVLTKAQRVANATRQWARMSDAERAEAVAHLRCIAKLGGACGGLSTSEKASAVAKASWLNMTPEQRRNRTAVSLSKMNSRTRAERIAAAHKAWITRRANVANRELPE